MLQNKPGVIYSGALGKIYWDFLAASDAKGLFG